MNAQLLWMVGMIGAVCTAILGQAELIGEPWRHIVTVLGVICTAVSGYMVQRPAPQWNGEERRKD